MGRAGRFGAKGLAITFLSDETEAVVLNDVQERFEVHITEMPGQIEFDLYSKELYINFKFSPFSLFAKKVP